MTYSDSIEALKAGLSQYSESEKQLTELYKQAIANAEAEYKTAVKQVNDQYKRDRNEAHADTVREERSLNNMLAARGLGFSGEAAQAKLNSNIILSNRLGELNRGKVDAETKLSLDLSDKKSALSLDNAEKIREVQKGRDDLNAKIASIIAEREDNAAKIKAEKEMAEAKLKAEMEMLELELNAKNNNSSGNGVGSSGGQAGGSGYTPTMTAKELAKALITTASGGGSSIDGSHAQQYSINKYLTELTDKYKVSEEYVNDLIFVLRSYGYEDVGESKRRTDVITYEAITYYYNQYDKYYDLYINRGFNEGKAHTEAKKAAQNEQLEYIYENSRNTYEFKECCNDIGISLTEVTSFLNSKSDKKGSAGSSNNGYGVDTAG